jgi:ABC-2 type transport system ATP-binding protein
MRLSADNISKKYGNKVAVKDISFELKTGQTLGLLGPNGSGKSTTIKILTGQLASDSGVVLYDGKPISQHNRSVNELIGVMPQEVVIWEHLTIDENLKFAGLLYRLSSRDIKERSSFLIDMLQLGNERKTLARELSGGYKRRLNLAISIIHNPSIIFLDEPTPGIDPQSRAAMWDFINELKKSGKYAILLTDHYLDEAEKVCDEFLIIDEGSAIAKGTLSSLKKQYGNGKIIKIELAEEFVKGNVGIAALQKLEKKILASFPNSVIKGREVNIPTVKPEKELFNILKIVSDEKLEYDDVSLSEASLEDIFLLLTGKEIRS